MRTQRMSRAQRTLAAMAIAVLLAFLPTAVAGDTTAADVPAITLHVFGPELPFMFQTARPKRDFRWSALIAMGNTGIGTITHGAGEVIGVDGDYYVANAADPTPRRVSAEKTPSGAVASFKGGRSLSIAGPVDLDGLQSALDAVFVDTETYIYMFRAEGVLQSVTYQLEGPRPDDALRAAIASGKSQKAVTLGTTKHQASNVAATLVGVRAPPYLNTVFEIPYHMHFLAADRSLLGHVTALKAENLQIKWARTEALDLRYWRTQ